METFLILLCSMLPIVYYLMSLVTDRFFSKLISRIWTTFIILAMLIIIILLWINTTTPYEFKVASWFFAGKEFIWGGDITSFTVIYLICGIVYYLFSMLSMVFNGGGELDNTFFFKTSPYYLFSYILIIISNNIMFLSFALIIYSLGSAYEGIEGQNNNSRWKQNHFFIHRLVDVLIIVLLLYVFKNADTQGMSAGMFTIITIDKFVNNYLGYAILVSLFFKLFWVSLDVLINIKRKTLDRCYTEVSITALVWLSCIYKMTDVIQASLDISLMFSSLLFALSIVTSFYIIGENNLKYLLVKILILMTALVSASLLLGQLALSLYMVIGCMVSITGFAIVFKHLQTMTGKKLFKGHKWSTIFLGFMLSMFSSFPGGIMFWASGEMLWVARSGGASGLYVFFSVLVAQAGIVWGVTKVFLKQGDKIQKDYKQNKRKSNTYIIVLILVMLLMIIMSVLNFPFDFLFIKKNFFVTMVSNPGVYKEEMADIWFIFVWSLVFVIEIIFIYYVYYIKNSVWRLDRSLLGIYSRVGEYFQVIRKSSSPIGRVILRINNFILKTFREVYYMSERIIVVIVCYIQKTLQRVVRLETHSIIGKISLLIWIMVIMMIIIVTKMSI